MAFVNEYIPEADVVKYGIKELNKRHIGQTNSSDWTIDRERDIYLRQVTNGREDESDQSGWHLYLKGSLFWFQLQISGKGVRGGEGQYNYKLLGSDLSESLSPAKKQEIVDALKEALVAYRDGGVYSSTTSCTITFDF